MWRLCIRRNSNLPSRLLHSIAGGPPEVARGMAEHSGSEPSRSNAMQKPYLCAANLSSVGYYLVNSFVVNNFDLQLHIFGTDLMIIHFSNN